MHYYAWMDGPAVFCSLKFGKKNKATYIYIYINPEIFCLGFLPKKQRMPCANLPMNETTFPPTSSTWQWRSRSRAKASGQGLCETRRSTRRLQGTRWTFQQFTGGIVEHLLPAKHTNNLFHQNGGMKKTIFGPFTRSTFVSPIQLLFEAAKNFMYKKRWRPWWGFCWRGHVMFFFFECCGQVWWLRSLRPRFLVAVSVS